MNNRCSHWVMCKARNSFQNSTNPLLSHQSKYIEMKYTTKRENIVMRGFSPFLSFVRRRILKVGNQSAVHGKVVAWQHDVSAWH